MIKSKFVDCILVNVISTLSPWFYKHWQENRLAVLSVAYYKVYNAVKYLMKCTDRVNKVIK